MTAGDYLWDEKSIADLTMWWDEGLSCREIARRLGVSGNAVIGKKNRLNLSKRDNPVKRKLCGSPVKPQGRPRANAVKPLPELPEYIIPVTCTSHGLIVHDVPPPQIAAPLPIRSSSKCCWPLGELRTKTFRFCDGESVWGKPYCAEHCKVAYVRVRVMPEYAD